MIHLYSTEPGALRRAPEGSPIDERVVWVDMVDPSIDEIRRVDLALGVEMPTREEMREIEASSRLYEEDGALYMTATVLSAVETGSPVANAVTFVLTHGRLVTLRHTDPLPFRSFAAHIDRHPSAVTSAEGALFGLLEAIVDRLADVLEVVGAEIDQVSQTVFAAGNRTRGITPGGARSHKPRGPAPDYEAMIASIGRMGDLTSKIRESLVSIGRLAGFAGRNLRGRASKTGLAAIKTITRDVVSLSDHASYLANKLSFMLDATLGLIQIEQNGIIKIFSVVAVVFLPPTLIASIYGMNFEVMPELSWTIGYPLALMLMVGSAIMPYWLFKRRGWL
ncbi:magnesium transport protein CorA [Tistrella bauzanensis]|uniref:Magnesium transport protein CorA n=1 Tax=Tistrella bauzanensis TaxID=657419 RepID=A0ABQ1IWI1_9PROT|nr:magnesium transporter CorA family protein [Tistrella bauzanensis]GGB54216.1 magnesium transport protein CorA [Tistrella bauzanensis]